MYENNIISNQDLLKENNYVIINKDFYTNIPLNQINNIKKLLKDIKNINCKSINYDFINDKILIDNNMRKI